MERTISGRIGEGDIRHTIRDFLTDNVDPNRVKDDIIIVNRNIKDVYHELFDEALTAYNAKQTRKDRVIKDYREHIRHSRQEKEFHEAIFQIGNKDDTNCFMEEGRIATEILQKFAEEFEQRNPHLWVIAAAVHFDEHTPHLHIDFIPFTTGQKRGLSTRVSLRGALEQQGFVGEGKLNTCSKLWVDSEKQRLSEMMLERSIEWKQLGTHRPHLSVLNFKKQEREKEVQELERKVEVLENKAECAGKLLKHREELLEHVEGAIDSLDNQYQEKKAEYQKTEEALSEKSAELEKTSAELADNKALLEKSAKKVSQIRSVDSIETKPSFTGKKVIISQEDYGKLSNLAKKQIAAEQRDSGMEKQIEKLMNENNQLAATKELLTEQNAELRKKNSELNSVRGDIALATLRSERDNLKRKLDNIQQKLDTALEFIRGQGLWDKLKALFPVFDTARRKGQHR